MAQPKGTDGRLICVSNRLPVTVSEHEGDLTIHPSSGGLVTALWPVLQRSGGVWVGWLGQEIKDTAAASSALEAISKDVGFSLRSVPLTEIEVEGYYRGFANRVIWPLFHDLQSNCNFDPQFWQAYLKAMQQFLGVLSNTLQPADLIWVNDFQLMGLGGQLRDAGFANRCCFFLHIPFPAPDIFFKLPWRLELVKSLLRYDLIGFQTKRDLKNFIDCVEHLECGQVVSRAPGYVIKDDSHQTLIDSFPISIDFNEFADLANLEEIVVRSQSIRKNMGVTHLAISVDRLDYTKGIPQRIRAYARMLERFESLRGKTGLIQLVVPSREEVPEYHELLLEIERIVTKVNGTYGQPGWTPVQHFLRSITREELVAFYAAADVAVVTPLKDGMNLVAKEFCAAQRDEIGVLILSEFAGAAAELGSDALLVNPYDIDGVAEALKAAFEMPIDMKKERMKSLRQKIRKADVFSWADAFLERAGWKPDHSNLQEAATGIWKRLRRYIAIFDA